jgi:glycerophosphoryl diester phosphodiesterase
VQRGTPSPPPPTDFAYLDTILEPGASVLAMAHRGGAKVPELVGLENTLAAFRHAASLGYTYLETDVHATRDDVLVAFHDDVLDRVTDRSGRIAELTAAEVTRARIGGTHPVPTMAELLEELPDARFNIDVKSESAVELLVDLLDRTGAHDRVLVGAFSRARLATFRRLTGGRVATSASPLEVVAVKLLPPAVVRRLVRKGRRPAALQVPHRRGPLTVVTPGLVRRAHAAGLHVHVWTVDEPEEMIELLDLGVDGLITDRTDVLRDVLVARGQWREHR